MSKRILSTCATITLFLAFTITAGAQANSLPVVTSPPNGQFNLKLDAGAIVNLRRDQDRVDTDYIQTGRRLGVG